MPVYYCYSNKLYSYAPRSETPVQLNIEAAWFWWRATDDQVSGSTLPLGVVVTVCTRHSFSFYTHTLSLFSLPSVYYTIHTPCAKDPQSSPRSTPLCPSISSVPSPFSPRSSWVLSSPSSSSSCTKEATNCLGHSSS